MKNPGMLQSTSPFKVVLLAGVALGVAVCTASAQVNVDLGSDADTAIRFGTGQGNNYGTGGDMYLRELTDVREYMGYVRFDLSSLAVDLISDASLTLTKVESERNDSMVASRFALYGLNDVATNTPQTWGETSLTFDSAGAERIPRNAPAGSLTVLDPDHASAPNVTEVFTGTGVGDTVTVSGPDLVSFLQGRVDAASDAGLVTFIVDFPGPLTSDRGYGLGTKENALSEAVPLLSLTYTPVPEPTSAALLLMGAGALGWFVRRRR